MKDNLVRSEPALIGSDVLCMLLTEVFRGYLVS